MKKCKKCKHMMITIELGMNHTEAYRCDECGEELCRQKPWYNFKYLIRKHFRKLLGG